MWASSRLCGALTRIMVAKQRKPIPVSVYIWVEVEMCTSACGAWLVKSCVHVQANGLCCAWRVYVACTAACDTALLTQDFKCRTRKIERRKGGKSWEESVGWPRNGTDVKSAPSELHVAKDDDQILVIDAISVQPVDSIHFRCPFKHSE